jgi:hypothetical protein
MAKVKCKPLMDTAWELGLSLETLRRAYKLGIKPIDLNNLSDAIVSVGSTASGLAHSCSFMAEDVDEDLFPVWEEFDKQRLKYTRMTHDKEAFSKLQKQFGMEHVMQKYFINALATLMPVPEDGGYDVLDEGNQLELLHQTLWGLLQIKARIRSIKKRKKLFGGK